jgi:hypothetical protein
MLFRRSFAHRAALAAFSAGVGLSACSDLPDSMPPAGSGGQGPAAGAGQSSGRGGAAGSGGAAKGGAGGQASGKGGSAGTGGSGGGSSGTMAGGKGGESGADEGGSAGAAGKAGSGAGRGGQSNGGRAGSGGVGGRGGAGNGGKSGSAGSGEAGGAPAGEGCASGEYLICEDFESTAIGDVPDGWTRHGDEANVDDDEAHAGSKALKLGQVASAERRIYRSATVLGSAHWGRLYYKVLTPPPDAFVHSTIVAFRGVGPTVGASEFRTVDLIKQAKNTPDVGSRHNFAYNVEPDDGPEFNQETNYDYTFDDDWHCAEYHIQASNQSYEFFLDGESILEFENGAGEYDGSEIPDSFSEVRVGWINYQNAAPGFTAWIDDLAFDDERIGCD